MVGPVVTGCDAFEQTRRPARTALARCAAVCGEPTGRGRDIETRHRRLRRLGVRGCRYECAGDEQKDDGTHQRTSTSLTASTGRESAHGYNSWAFPCPSTPAASSAPMKSSPLW